MKSQLTWQNAQILERSDRQPTQTQQGWKSQFNHLWQSIVARLAFTQEPHVWQVQNGQGEQRWNAYDPKTGRSVSNQSADELRVWLEKRYYPTGITQHS